MIFPYKDNIPSRSFPVFTVLIIIVNVLAFLFEVSLGQQELTRFIFQYGVVPARLRGNLALMLNPSFLTSIFTSMFLHGGLIHLLGNMWWLWIFGDNVEDRLGHVRYLLFYLLCGFSASVVHTIFNFTSRYPAIGASGAIAGVLGAYMITFPAARVYSLVTIIFFWTTVELPALFVLGFWFVIQLMSGTASVALASQSSGGVAWWAHIGGFVTGIVLMKLLEPPRKMEWYA